MKPKIPKSKRKNLPPPSASASAAAAVDESNVSSTIRDDSSRYIGVTYRSRRKKYQARMYRGSHEYNLGLFDLAADAALAYDAAHRVAGGGGISSSTTPSSTPSKTSKGGDARGSRGSSSMITDAEEIKYALDWIDCADEMERPSGLPEDDPVHLNFLRPSDFRQAREKEISSHKDKNNSNNDDDVVFPTESDLKLRVKQEILNIAKTYVSQQAKTPGPPDEGSDLTSSNDDEEELPGGDNPSEAVRKKGSRPAKKRKLQQMNLSAGYEDRHEEAHTLLSLNKRSTKESKQAARAQKLLEFMTGGEAAVDSNYGQVSASNQADDAKENPNGSDDRKQSSSDAETIQQQLQQNLARQQALTIDSFHGSFNQSALMSSLLSQYSLEQVLRFARERPDLVNEETIREFVRAQRTDMSQQLLHNNNQTDLLHTQLQAAMMTGGHFNPTQLPIGMQTLAAESIQSRNNTGGGNAKEINRGGAKNGADTQQDGQATFRPSEVREPRPSDESPFLMHVLEEYKKQGVGNQDQAALQKKIANEAKRAALAQKLSIHLSNETEAPIATTEASKTGEKETSDEPPPVGDSKDKATAAPPDNKEDGDSEILDKKTSSNSKVDRVGGTDSSNVGTDASNQVKPMGRPNATPSQSRSVAGSVPFAGLQQGNPSLQQAMDPFQQAILQHVMVNGNAQQHQHMSQSYGGGNTLEMPAQEVALRLQQRLMNEEYRLQQLRQTLQTQALLPYLNMGGFGVSGPNNVLNHMAGNNAFAGGLANSLMQQSMNNNNQELLLQQALALQSNQNASMSGVLQSPVNNEQMLLAAQSQGMDAGTLAQLLMNRGGASQPPSSSSKKD